MTLKKILMLCMLYKELAKKSIFMTRYYLSNLVIISITIFTNIAQAKLIEFNKPIIASAVITSHNSLSNTENTLQTKKVYLMNIKLTTQQKKDFLNYNIHSHKDSL